mmetsp:Transcript_5201/g.9125  ORF Transcript_5201/g.9125 Transcript_5201/m.9125 type:complete len:574 (-) Transcript_5201:48-1769(-)
MDFRWLFFVFLFTALLDPTGAFTRSGWRWKAVYPHSRHCHSFSVPDGCRFESSDSMSWGNNHDRRNRWVSRQKLRPVSSYRSGNTVTFASNSNSNSEVGSSGGNNDLGVHVAVVAVAGLGSDELNLVLEAVAESCEEQGIVSHVDPTVLPILAARAIPPSAPGALGRVVLLSLNGLSEYDDDDLWISAVQSSIATRIDEFLYDTTSPLHENILVSIQTDLQTTTTDDKSVMKLMHSIVDNEIAVYGLRTPISSDVHKKDDGGADEEATMVPSIHVEMDGAMVESPDSNDPVWDTSSILVFDDLISDDLRQRLLDVVLGKDKPQIDTNWDDVHNGPDPMIWERGGYLDSPDMNGQDNEADEDNDEGPCWGLREEALLELCAEGDDTPDAIREFESQVLTPLFRDFCVTRLPEAVLGASVTPLTANAPTCKDVFDYHIDADPNQAPPSPWTDVFGRYPNRMAGKPRFISCLLYLNSDWNVDEYGAPTRFIDPPTGETHDVTPRSGRCLIMDQDMRHTVVAPNKPAGPQPRYSLVWKLILHPKEHNQNMNVLCAEQNAASSSWPDTIRIGSASTTH